MGKYHYEAGFDLTTGKYYAQIYNHPSAKEAFKTTPAQFDTKEKAEAAALKYVKETFFKDAV